jgi:hypothetical protein
MIALAAMTFILQDVIVFGWRRLSSFPVVEDPGQRPSSVIFSRRTIGPYGRLGRKWRRRTLVELVIVFMLRAVGLEPS